MLDSLKVLLVEDKREMRLIVRTVLISMGIKNISESEDGEEALFKLRELTPDLIISDWNMPRKNGIELLAAVRQDPKLAQVPFFMLTSENDVSHIQEAVDLGVTDYLVKPFQANILEGKIKKILQYT